MKSKSLIALALITVAGLAQAQTTSSNVSTSSLGDGYRSLKEGPLDLSFNLAVDAVRDAKTNEVNGVTHTDIAYLSYKLTPNDSLRLENRMTIKNLQNQDSDSTYARTVLSYKRSNILTEKDNGVGLSAQLEKRYVPDAQMRAKGNTYGLNRISATATKNIGPVSLANTIYFAATDVRNKADQSTARTYAYGVFTQSLNLPSDFSLSLTEEVFRDQNQLNTDESREVILTAELGKQFSPEIYLGASIVGTPISNTVDWSSDAKWVSKFTYGVNLNIVAF